MTHSSLAHYSGLPSAFKAQRDYILLDGSYSMQKNWWPMLNAIQTYIDGLRANGTESFLTCSVFSGYDLALDHYHGPVADWQHVAEHPIRSTWGGTPLYDAINHAVRRLRDEQPGAVALTIVTDGEDTDSRTEEAQARQILEWCRALGWQVSFIGCDWNNSKLAAALGVPVTAAIGVSTANLSQAAEELAKKRSRFANSGAPMHWSESEQQQFGGYLSGSK